MRKPQGSSAMDIAYNAAEMCSKSCFDLQYLYFVCLWMRPKKVVETGVHMGASSAFMLKALDITGGILFSIDLPNVEYNRDDGNRHWDVFPEEIGSGFAIPQSLKNSWQLVIGDSRDQLANLLEQTEEIDIFHHDSMHTYDLMAFEYETAWKYLRQGGLLLSHDVNWNSAFVDFCEKHSVAYRIYKGKHTDIGITVKL